MFPRLKTWDSSKDERVSRPQRVTLEYPKIADARVLANADAGVPATASLTLTLTLTPVAVRAG